MTTDCAHPNYTETSAGDVTCLDCGFEQLFEDAEPGHQSGCVCLDCSTDGIDYNDLNLAEND